MKSELKSTIESIPGYFYDAIVYYSSYVIFVSLLVILFSNTDILVEFIKSLTIAEKIIGFIVFFSFGYVWGQFSSALSYSLIKIPVTFLVKKFKPKKIDDFLFSFDEVVASIDTKQILKDKTHRNYWTVLYFIQAIDPWTGSDLIKRYARCKLARVNAFNFIMLAILGIIMCISSVKVNFLSWFQYFVFIFIFIILFFFEFYQRQVWFGDIVIKSLSAILAAQDKKKKYTT